MSSFTLELFPLCVENEEKCHDILLITQLDIILF